MNKINFSLLAKFFLFILSISLVFIGIFSLNAYSFITTVTVQPGETLSQIADSHNTTVASIMSFNGLHNYVIYPGEKLKVVSGGYNHSAYRPAVTYGHYKVQFGDTLSLIAQKYGTSVADLRKLNGLYSSVIRQGAVLVVPVHENANQAPPQVSATVTVQPGETLSQIADSHNTTVASIMSFNGLHNYIIYPGEKLKVVSGGYNHSAYRPAVTYGHYKVQFGDTLSLIAQKYGTSVADLRKLNGLYSNVIRQGAVLVVPESYRTAQINNNDNDNKYNYYRVATFQVLTGGKKNNGPKHNAAKRNNNVSIGRKIVDTAFRYKGVPYAWGGTTRTGMDCSGFVQRVFAKDNIHLPRTAREQSRLGKYIPKSRLKPGDLLFFRTYAPYISHVGIYIGHGKFIQENSSAGTVTVTSLSNEYFERTYAFAKSIK